MQESSCHLCPWASLLSTYEYVTLCLFGSCVNSKSEDWGWTSYLLIITKPLLCQWAGKSLLWLKMTNSNSIIFYFSCCLFLLLFLLRQCSKLLRQVFELLNATLESGKALESGRFWGLGDFHGPDDVFKKPSYMIAEGLSVIQYQILTKILRRWYHFW